MAERVHYIQLYFSSVYWLLDLIKVNFSYPQADRLAHACFPSCKGSLRHYALWRIVESNNNHCLQLIHDPHVLAEPAAAACCENANNARDDCCYRSSKLFSGSHLFFFSCLRDCSPGWGNGVSSSKRLFEEDLGVLRIICCSIASRYSSLIPTIRGDIGATDFIAWLNVLTSLGAGLVRSSVIVKLESAARILSYWS